MGVPRALPVTSCHEQPDRLMPITRPVAASLGTPGLESRNALRFEMATSY